MGATVEKAKVTDVMNLAFEVADEQVRDPERMTVAEIVAERMGDDFDRLTVEEQDELLDRVEESTRAFLGACRKALGQARVLNGILAGLV